MNTDTDMDLGENPTLKEEVESTNNLKNFLVGYTGEKLKPKDNKVTVEMLVETMAEDFPEFLMAVAEENYIRGYHQALTDVDEGEAALKQEMERREKEAKTTKGKKKSAKGKKRKTS
tara:strand:+ start:631 stop:981 length:351 start_codon:yes stop_codon:yes gene_type:complete